MLRDFNQAGVLVAADVHVAARLTDDAGREPTSPWQLACALVVRAVRSGSVCLDLTEVRDEVGEEGAELAWPDLDDWLAALAASPLLGAPHPLRLEETRLYLDRYWREEEQVEQDLRRRAGRAAPPIADEAALRAALDRLFPGCVVRRAADGCGDRGPPMDDGADRRSRAPARPPRSPGCWPCSPSRRRLAGDRRPRIALTAPTGKAAARLEEAVTSEMADRFVRARHRAAGRLPGP